MAEKTEKATPKKLRDARKKGQVAKAQDFPSAFTFVISVIGTLVTAGYLYQNLRSYTVHIFQSIQGKIDLATQAGSYFSEALQVIMIASFPILVIVSFIGVLVNFLIIGPVFSFEAMKFQWKKLNPIEGIKQKFKLKVLIELLKSILKIIGAAIIIFFVIWNTLPDVVGSVRMPVYASALLLDLFLRKITIQVGIFFLAIALFDLAFQKRTFAKEMMMEKFEVKQEYKDTEGDPHIKGKRREVFREIAYSEGPRAAKRAKVIVTNPTHLAIALGYNEETKEVPTILTMGQRSIAEKIIEIAISEHIPIMRNVELAHELFNKGKIGDYIPEETYKAVAEILKWITTLEEKPSFAEELYR
jgi:type III secretion protein U